MRKYTFRVRSISRVLQILISIFITMNKNGYKTFIQIRNVFKSHVSKYYNKKPVVIVLPNANIPSYYITKGYIFMNESILHEEP